MVSVVYSLSTKYATEMSECEFLLQFDKTDTQECFFFGSGINWLHSQQW